MIKKYRVLSILKNEKGETIGAEVSLNGSVKKLKTDTLKDSNLKFDNAVLTKDGFVRAKKVNLI